MLSNEFFNLIILTLFKTPKRNSFSTIIKPIYFAYLFVNGIGSIFFLNSIDIDYVDELHQRYLVDKRLVEPSWRTFFDGYEFAKFSYEDIDKIPSNVLKEFKVINLINDYRSSGHLFTKTNPVRERRKYHPTLDIKNYGLRRSRLTNSLSSK